MPVLLLAMLVLGAVGLFLAMPGGRVGVTRVGWVLLAVAAAALLTAVIQGMSAEPRVGWFSAASLVALFAAVRVITHRRPVYSALYFVLLVVAVAVLLLVMQAEFLAAALIIVYAGAILVTYVFVIMLAQQSRPAPYDAKSREPFWGCLAGFVLLLSVASLLFPRGDLATGAYIPEAAGDVATVGTRLLTHYVVAIQIAGVLLLAAMVGAIAIARRKATAELEEEEVS